MPRDKGVCLRGGPGGITAAECGCPRCLRRLEVEADFLERHKLRTLDYDESVDDEDQA